VLPEGSRADLPQGEASDFDDFHVSGKGLGLLAKPFSILTWTNEHNHTTAVYGLSDQMDDCGSLGMLIKPLKKGI